MRVVAVAIVAVAASAALAAEPTSIAQVKTIIMRFNALAQGKTRIACIGGGTGLFTLLLGLKTLPNSLLTSIVNMSDDGGSRRQYRRRAGRGSPELQSPTECGACSNPQRGAFRMRA